MLHIALMSSENRAASALGRNYPGGLAAFVDAMNGKAQQLGMVDTHYVDANGLSSRNVASARDLAKLAMAAHQEPLLREYSTDAKAIVDMGGRPMQFSTTNYLVSSPGWEIGLQNRFHQRGGALPRDAGDDLRARRDHGVPRFQGKIVAHGRCWPHAQMAGSAQAARHGVDQRALDPLIL